MRRVHPCATVCWPTTAATTSKARSNAVLARAGAGQDDRVPGGPGGSRCPAGAALPTAAARSGAPRPPRPAGGPTPARPTRGRNGAARRAADPTDRRRWSDKIDYLHLIGRTDDVLAACRAAAKADPKWWRPPVLLAALATPADR